MKVKTRSAVPQLNMSHVSGLPPEPGKPIYIVAPGGGAEARAEGTDDSDSSSDEASERGGVAPVRTSATLTNGVVFPDVSAGPARSCPASCTTTQAESSSLGQLAGAVSQVSLMNAVRPAVGATGALSGANTRKSGSASAAPQRPAGGVRASSQTTKKKAFSGGFLGCTTSSGLSGHTTAPALAPGAKGAARGAYALPSVGMNPNLQQQSGNITTGAAAAPPANNHHLVLATKHGLLRSSTTAKLGGGMGGFSLTPNPTAAAGFRPAARLSSGGGGGPLVLSSGGGGPAGGGGGPLVLSSSSGSRRSAAGSGVGLNSSTGAGAPHQSVGRTVGGVGVGAAGGGRTVGPGTAANRNT